MSDTSEQLVVFDGPADLVVLSTRLRALFRATGTTAYLKNGGSLEIVQQIAAHESLRTTGLYDRRSDDANVVEVERIVI